MKQKLFMAFAAIMLSMGMVFAQTRTVQGTVTSSEDGEPIIGASVLVKGTALGTITNLDGEFTINNVPANSTLVVSYIGMKAQEVPAGANVNVALDPDNQVLDEVVVTALGLSREKKSLGYAVQEVKAEELNQTSQLNIGNALQGKVAGVQITQAGGAVGASQRILIRGNSSFGSNDPLIVIDGVPMDGSSSSFGGAGDGGGTMDVGTGLNDLNPDDIESISVLKGGSAALYGMRAGNGVILITTKKGSNAKGKMTVTYDGSFTVDRVYHLPSYQNKYGQGLFGEEGYYKLAQEGGYTGSYQDYALDYGYYYVDGMGSGVNDDDDESWGPRMDIGLMIPQFNSPLDAQGNHTATPWVSHPNNIKDFFQTGYSQSHNVSIANANDKGAYRASFGFRDQKGTIWNTDQKRYNFMVSGNYNFNKYISTDLSLTYSATRSDNLTTSGYSSNNPLQSIMQWFGRQVDMKDLKANVDKVDENGRYYNWNAAYHVNPYFNLKNNTNSYDRDRVIAKGSVFITPTDWLKFEGRIGYDMYYDKTFQKTLYSTDAKKGWFNEDISKRTELNADFIAYFNKQFGKFSVDALAGANYRDMTYHESGMGATGGNGLTIPGLYTMSNVIGMPSTSMDNSHIRSNSVYANASLGWNSQVYLEASARNDWSSTIKQNFFYPSVSLSWIPTETFEWLKSDVLSYLKIRGNYAKIGNATSAYRTGTYFSAAGNIGGVSQYYLPTTLPNSNLKPEKILTRELGIEAAFWKNRIRLDLALYNKETSDQIMSVEVPTSTGYRYSLVNAGKVTNKGLEISLSADIFSNPNGFSWTSTLNWAKDKSKIVELAEGLDTYTIASSWSCYNYAKVGESWGTLVGTALKRDANGNVIVYDDGTPQTSQGQVLGHVTPDWTAGWSNEFSYKNLSFGFLLDYRKGGDFFSVSQYFNTYTGILDYTAAGDIRERPVVLGKDIATEYTFVKEDGTPNDIAIMAHDWFADTWYGVKELSVNDGSYLKLREMHLTYQLPKKLLAKWGWIQDAKVSLVGNNVAILWLSSRNKAKIDPESTEGAGNGSVGFESNSVPPTRSFGLKLNLTF